MASKSWWQPLVALFRGPQPVPKRPGRAAIKHRTPGDVSGATQIHSSAGSRSWATDDSGSFSGLGGSPSQRTLQLQASTSAYPFHAVSIIPGAQACQAVYAFTGQRFLSRDAPRLPLAECNSSSCTCKFKHHKDRRAGPRRRSDFGFGISLWNGSERRKGRGRRADDS